MRIKLTPDHACQQSPIPGLSEVDTASSLSDASTLVSRLECRTIAYVARITFFGSGFQQREATIDRASAKTDMRPASNVTASK
jgi:hypothetical protein